MTGALRFTLGVSFASGSPRAASFAWFSRMVCSRLSSYSLTPDCSGVVTRSSAQRGAPAGGGGGGGGGGGCRTAAAVDLAAAPLGPSCSADPGGGSPRRWARRLRDGRAAVRDGTVARATLWRRYRRASRRSRDALATPGEAHRRPSRTAAPTVAGRGATVAAATLERRGPSPNTGENRRPSSACRCLRGELTWRRLHICAQPTQKERI